MSSIMDTMGRIVNFNTVNVNKLAKILAHHMARVAQVAERLKTLAKHLSLRRSNCQD